MNKIKITLQESGWCTDLRINGRDLDAGYKVNYSLNGKLKSNKVYMHNSGRSITLYIKIKGKRVMLQNEEVIYNVSPYSLGIYKKWYIEV